MELTILMPCLNEAETLEICIKKAKTFLAESNIDGEVLIADNGSDDGSIDIATRCGARVINVPRKGYGSALIAGTKNAAGKYVIMGDADDSYDFLSLMPFVEKLREGYDLVMGNRFAGGIDKDAMPFLHRYLGNPVLSFLGRLFFKSKIGDFHCGLRGFNRDRILELGLQTTGMEYASEMVVMSELAEFKITEVPTKLHKDGRSRAPHLRSFHDGWRHLKFLLMYAPNWLYLYPGVALILIGTVLGTAITVSNTGIGYGTVHLGIHTLLYCMLFVFIGVNLVYFHLYTQVYAERNGFIPVNRSISDRYIEDKGIFVGCFLVVLGIIFSIVALSIWGNTGFSNLDPTMVMKIAIPSVTVIAIGVEMIFSSFFIGILKINRKDNA